METISTDRIYWAVEYVEKKDGDIDKLQDTEFYIKADADKEIEFWKNESHKHYERWFSLNKQYEGWFGKVMRCERAERELRHQKYKRCLAMAKICECRTAYTCGRRLRHNLIWQERWMKLAEKFKDKEV